MMTNRNKPKANCQLLGKYELENDIPAVNGAKVLVEAFNKGAAPAPYNKAGFGGMKIEAIYVDENGGATKQVQELP